MSIYKLLFTKEAQKEWEKLDNSIKSQLSKKLKQRLQNPEISHDKLSGYENVYKIKLRTSGYRLAYEVVNDKIVVVVLKIGKRDKFYDTLQKYLSE